MRVVSLMKDTDETIEEAMLYAVSPRGHVEIVLTTMLISGRHDEVAQAVAAQAA